MLGEFDFILLFKFVLSAGRDLTVALKWPFKTNCLEEKSVGNEIPSRYLVLNECSDSHAFDPALFKKPSMFALCWINTRIKQKHKTWYHFFRDTVLQLLILCLYILTPGSG